MATEQSLGVSAPKAGPNGEGDSNGSRPGLGNSIVGMYPFKFYPKLPQPAFLCGPPTFMGTAKVPGGPSGDGR